MDLRELFCESYRDELISSVARSVSDKLTLNTKGSEKEHNQLAKDFQVKSSDQKSAIRAYTNASQINELLIKGTLSQYPGYTAQYKKLMSLKALGCHLSESHHVYSGLGGFDPTSQIRKHVFSTPAFLSGSLALKTAIKTSNFRTKENASPQDHILHLLLPAGFRGGFYIAEYSSQPEELEFLIFPHVKFEVVGRQTIQLKSGLRVIWTMKPKD